MHVCAKASLSSIFVNKATLQTQTYLYQLVQILVITGHPVAYTYVYQPDFSVFHTNATVLLDISPSSRQSESHCLE